MCDLLLQGVYQFSVPELSEPGTEVGQVQALDADIGPNAEMDYAVVGGDGLEVFSVTANKTTQNGVLRVRKVKLVHSAHVLRVRPRLPSH